jgi:uncharacterized protein
VIVYEGTVRHRRHEPVTHEFEYPVQMAYRDVEVPAIRELAGSSGPIRVLELGRGFNPVRFYYCFDDHDQVERVVAEVTNTPWGEQHAYVLDPGEGKAEKAFHVSPFLGMDHEYRFRIGEPGERLMIHIDLDDSFDATLTLRRREEGGRLTSPLATKLRIYRQALRLKLKGAPYFPHPGRVGR